MEETRVPEEVVSSSVPVSDAGVGVVGSVGASLTGVTVMLAVSVLGLKAVVHPVGRARERVAVLPAEPLVLSQARNVNVAVPLKSALGTKRILFALSRSRAVAEMSTDEPVVLVKSVQVEPPLVENCHLPLVLSTAVTAMASTAALSPATSVMEPSTIMADTVSPAEVVLSSLMAVSAGLWLASSSGAS